jgi:hypothetical protein
MRRDELFINQCIIVIVKHLYVEVGWREFGILCSSRFLDRETADDATAMHAFSFNSTPLSTVFGSISATAKQVFHLHRLVVGLYFCHYPLKRLFCS